MQVPNLFDCLTHREPLDRAAQRHTYQDHSAQGSPCASLERITSDFHSRGWFLPECVKLVEADVIDRLSDRNFTLPF